MSTLSTATGAKEVVVQLIIARGIGTIENGRRSAFQANDDCRICLVGKDVSTQAIRLPAKVIGIVEAALDRLPFASEGSLDVSVCSHLGEGDDGGLVTDVGS